LRGVKGGGQSWPALASGQTKLHQYHSTTNGRTLQQGRRGTQETVSFKSFRQNSTQALLLLNYIMGCRMSSPY